MILDLDEVVDHACQAHAQATGAAIDVPQTRSTFADIIARLRAAGITLPVILQYLGPILQMILAGTPAGAIVTAILAFLGQTAPTLPGGAGS
jgi:ABC-type phosphate/phosphonate transport system permease subunit